MKADPEAQQQLQGIYTLEEPDGSDVMALQIDYENMEESLRSMLHHNGQPTFSEKEDTTRQMHAYKNAISKFRNHISYVERENHALKTQMASLATHAMNGDTITQHQRAAYVSAQAEMSQLEDIRVTCAMLSERIKRMEEQNNMLLMNAEKQRCDYERCLERVASQVFQTLSYQRRLQMECDALRMQVHHLTGTLPHSLPGSTRSSETSPNGQSNHASAPDDVLNQYGSYAHVPYNVVSNGYSTGGNRMPYSPTTRAEMSSPISNTSIANQTLPGVGIYERRGNYVNCNLQYQPLSTDHVQFNGDVDPQYDRQALSPHRIQTAKTPPLHAIPESIEPVSASAQDLTHFRPRLPRSGSGMIVGTSPFVSQRTAYDDEAVGRTSRSRDRQKPTERNKVVRSRSFDGHFSYARTAPVRQNASLKQPGNFSPPSYRPGPPLNAVPMEQVDQCQAQKLRADPMPPSGSTICSPYPDELAQSSHVADEVPEDRQNVVTNVVKTLSATNPSSPAAHTATVSSLVAQQSSMNESQELRSTTARESREKSLSRGGLQRSFRVTKSCERREQRKTVDDVWLPRSGGPTEPMSMRVANNRHINGSKNCNPSLPPPPPPPPNDQTTENHAAEEIAKSQAPSVGWEGQTLYDPVKNNEPTDVAREKAHSMDKLNDQLINANSSGMAASPAVLPTNYATLEAVSQHDDVFNEKSTSPNTTEDVDGKLPQRSPTQLQPPNLLPNKKSTKREAPKPPNVTPPAAHSTLATNMVRNDGTTPSVSCDTLLSSENDTKEVPRRLSEGMVKEMSKRSRLAPPSRKKRVKETQRLPADSQDASHTSAASNSPPGVALPPGEHSGKNGSIQSKKPQSPTRTVPLKVSPEIGYTRYSPDASEPTRKAINQFQAQRENRGIKSTKSASNKKPTNAPSSSESHSKDMQKKDENRVAKKTEAKKKSGNQKTFVDMMKSKFGGRGSNSKKENEVQARHDNAIREERTVISVIDPRTLSLEPNSFPPESAGKKSSKKTDHDPVGRKLSRPFLDAHVDSNVTPIGFSASKTEASNKKGFLGRNNSKRSKNSRQNAFENGDHFNDVPYGRVELIPIGAPIPNPTENDVVVGQIGETRQKNIADAPSCGKIGDENVSNTKKAPESFSQTRRQMNDYENVVILGELGKPLSNFLASHSYENVVIVNTAERSGEAGHKEPQTSDQVDDDTTTGEVRIKRSIAKQPSPLQKLWTSFSNHSLNKISGSESGSRTALNDIGMGRSLVRQPNSEKGGAIAGEEQQMFEKAYISSVVEAELNSKEKREANVVEMDNALENFDERPDIDGGNELAQSSDYSSHVDSCKSSMATFDTKESSSSGFDSWPTKGTGSSSRIENPRGGSLDARFRDVKSIQEIEIGGQSFLQKRPMVDSRSSLGSYGYGSGVSGSSTTSSNKSRGLSPPRQNCEETNARNFSSSDNDLASTPQPNSLQSRYAARRFASPIANVTPGNKLPKHQGLPKPKSSVNPAKVKMGVSGISPPKSHGAGSESWTFQNGDHPKKLAPLSCNAKPSAPPTVNSKNKETRRSGLPTRASAGSSRFGLQRTSIPVRHSGSRMQHHDS